MTDIKTSILDEIINEKSIEVEFQPIVSIARKSVIGFEGIVSAIITKEQSINSKQLFEKTIDNEFGIKIDRICREEVVKSYGAFHGKHKDMLLFLNIQGSVITEDIVGSGVLLNLIEKYNIKPQNVILEIVESTAMDEIALSKFIDLYRGYGFLIALDDLGAGWANLDRIAFIKPDVVKINKSIMRDLHIDYYKQEVFKSLVTLGKNLGSLVIAVGVENEQEAIKSVELGADLLQGGYFSEPKHISKVVMKSINTPIRKLATMYEEYTRDKIELQKIKFKEYGEIIKDTLKILEHEPEARFNYKLLDIIAEYRIFECIYILDSKGIQVTDTITPYLNVSKHKGMVFKPAQLGDDHSVKKYYYLLKNMRVTKYITEPYISMASGNLCITMSSIFKNIENKKYILCIDFNSHMSNF